MESIMKPKYYGVFPVLLFACPDNRSMHFVLSLKNINKEQVKELIELLKYCSASVTLNVEEATKHSAIIVDHDEVVNYKAPAFTLSFLEDCFNQLRVQNISDFRQTATSHIAKDFPCMNVVYYKDAGWDTVLGDDEKMWFDEQQILSEPTTVYETASEASLGRNSEQESLSPMLNCAGTKEIEISDDDDSDLEVEPSPPPRITAHNSLDDKKLRISKTQKDETNLIVETTKCNGSLQPTNLLREKSRVEHNQKPKKWAFLDEFQSDSSDEEYIAKNKEQSEESRLLNLKGKVTSSCLSQPTNQRKELDSEKSKAEVNDKDISSASSVQSQRAFLDEFQSDSSDEEYIAKNKEQSEESRSLNLKGKVTSSCPSQPTNQRKELDSEKSKAEVNDKDISSASSVQSQSTSKDLFKADEEANGYADLYEPAKNKKDTSKDLFKADKEADGYADLYEPAKNKKEHFFEDFSEAESSSDLLYKKKDMKRSRMAYSYEEQKNILNYIIVHNEYHRVKGRELWMIMERRKVCPSRTWQSMKEHFIKKIIPCLNAFEITEDQRRKIRNAFYN